MILPFVRAQRIGLQRRRLRIDGVAVIDPLRDVAAEVIDPDRVRCETADRRRDGEAIVIVAQDVGQDGAG